MNTNPFTRRQFLKRSAAAGSLVALACDSTSNASIPASAPSNPYGSGDEAACAATPPNIEGPYYRAHAPARTSLNIFNEPGYSLRVQGRVLAPECGVDSGIADATIDVWQANAYGQYDNTSADFKFRGVLKSDAFGGFAFDTIYPGAYDLGTGQYRPSHIHVKVTAPGFQDLTTQLYFPNDPWNATDPFIDKNLIMSVTKQANGSFVGLYDFVLERAT